MTKWITENGTVMDIKSMSDNHLNNAINYAQKRGDVTSLHILRNEMDSRKKKIKYKSPKCKYCGNNMAIQEIALEPEVGFVFDKMQFVCLCGAASPTFYEKDVEEFLEKYN